MPVAPQQGMVRGRAILTPTKQEHRAGVRAACLQIQRAFEKRCVDSNHGGCIAIKNVRTAFQVGGSRLRPVFRTHFRVFEGDLAMKTSFFGWLTCLFVVTALTVGCDKETDEGGPGAEPGARTMSGQSPDTSDNMGTDRTRDQSARDQDLDEQTFTLQLPDGVNAAQDEATETSIELNAGDQFNQDVAVTLKAPQGVTITPSEFTLNKNQTEQKLRIQASPTAKEGDVVVGVTGKPATGKMVESSFKVTIDLDDSQAAEPAPRQDTTTPRPAPTQPQTQPQQ